MGINVSHGSNQWGEERRSATSVANLGKHLAHVLTSRDWDVVADLFDGTFADQEDIPPAEARRIAAVLYKAADHRLMPSDWGSDARLFADAANRAATAGQNWRWR
ncbi:DUF7739 domain-containing protein [Streptomyces tanashiensis]|uniref:DUF7739 domain-containing protein n=1 Tax=Streptomyces tanashiensis TaxID=67367 RepID=UPI0034088FC0